MRINFEQKNVFLSAGCCALPLSPYCFVLPSRPLVTLAGCCMLSCICCHIDLCHPLIISSHQLLVVCCTPLSPYLVAPPSCPLVMPASCCILRHLCYPILLCRPLALLSLAFPLLPYHVAPPSCLLSMPDGCCMLRCPPTSCAALSLHRLVVTWCVASP